MLFAKTLNITIAALSSSSALYKVVFDYDAGNLLDWDRYDEVQSSPHIEIVDVFDGEKSVYNLLSNEEEWEIVDVLFAYLEDE